MSPCALETCPRVDSSTFFQWSLRVTVHMVWPATITGSAMKTMKKEGLKGTLLQDFAEGWFFGPVAHFSIPSIAFAAAASAPSIRCP